MTMHTRRLPTLAVPLLLAGFLACSLSCNPPAPAEPPPAGTVSAALEVGSLLHDVTAVRFDVVMGAASDCSATAVASRTVALESEPLPASVEGGAGKHAFADGLFVLAPGDYRLCATPLAGESPSTDCGPASAPAAVVADQTTEVVLVSQCRASGNGGADVVVSLNDPPQIGSVVLDPSKFITTCEAAKITATASDPNGDALTYAWSVMGGGTLVSSGAVATFSTRAAGDYTVALSVSDGRGGSTSLTFPVHVSAATCAVPAAIQAIIDANCSPCHTAGTSGGLSMASPEVTFANLVDHGAASAACAGRVRVVRGDPASSYIIAKLRNLAPICGVQMPRGRPPLPEETIQTIEAWISALPR
jgi:hypothetical protein